MSDLVGDARYLSPSVQEALRLRVVAALVAGREREEVTAVFGVSLKAIDGWWAKWQAGGGRRWSCSRVASRAGCIRCSGRPGRPLCGRRSSITGPATWV